MKNEMDLMKMDGPERYAWLRANRLTLITVGLVWIGMIAARINEGVTPWFLIAMVPVFAMIRFAAFLYIKRSRQTAAARVDANARPGTTRPHAGGNHPGSSVSLLLP
ncbi:MAG: hypothetical protein JSW50_03525 [Candidatus Latescibacterota bacterium]|nr:MAG: hypothetical protein JSW50_03525 [Candidatus Latescibacterota bacterium]